MVIILSCFQIFVSTLRPVYTTRSALRSCDLSNEHLLMLTQYQTLHCKNNCSWNIFIGKTNIFPLFSLSDICQYQLSDYDTQKYQSVWIHIMTLSTDKNNNICLNVSTYISTSITVGPIGLAAILVIMYVSTFKTVVILYTCIYIIFNIHQNYIAAHCAMVSVLAWS